MARNFHTIRENYVNNKHTSTVETIRNGDSIVSSTINYDTRSTFQKSKDRYRVLSSGVSTGISLFFVLLLAVALFRCLFLNGGVSPFQSTLDTFNNPQIEITQGMTDLDITLAENRYILEQFKEPISGIPTFDGALVMFQNCPQITLSLTEFMSSTTLQLPDWLAFMQPLFNFFGQIIGFIGWLLSSLINVLMLFVYFIGWVFTG